MMTGAVKRFKQLVQSIGTHNGTFHCDEVLAVAMLKMLPECKDAKVIRTRDESTLKDCDVVVDVGSVYEPQRHRYDHHQRTFSETMSSLTDGVKPWVTRLSSAGLIYHHFGREVIMSQLVDCEPASLEDIYDHVYEGFVEEVDAVDNGINQTDGTPRYQVTSTLGARVSRLNAAWNEPAADPAADADARFQRAVALVGGEFCEAVRRAHGVWLPARRLVAAALQQRHQVDAGGAIMELSAGGAPWKQHLFSLESRQQPPARVLFVIFTDQNGQYRVQAVPPHNGSFDMRVPLPAEWRGLRDDELAKAADIEGATFVHAAGFIGGARSREAALQMARQALKLAGEL